MTSNCYEVSKVLSISVTNYILIPEKAVRNSELSVDNRNIAYVEHKNTSGTVGQLEPSKIIRKISGRHDMKELQNMAYWALCTYFRKY
jgi:hypothetical protein